MSRRRELDTERLGRMAHAAWPVLEAAFGKRDICVASTRLLLDALGPPPNSYALRVIASVANPAYRAWVDAHGRLPIGGTDDEPEIGAVRGWMVTLGDPRTVSPPGKWPGHLVAIVERRWLVDLSLPQAERPEYGILLAPVVAPVTEAFLRGRGALVGGLGASTVEYSALPGDRDYRRAPDWQAEAPRARRLVERVRHVWRTAGLYP